MTINKYNDSPIDEVAKLALEVIQHGGIIHQKWTCAHCGARQTMEVPNTFFRRGQCEECNQITPIIICGFMAQFARGETH